MGGRWSFPIAVKMLMALSGRLRVVVGAVGRDLRGGGVGVHGGGRGRLCALGLLWTFLSGLNPEGRGFLVG